MIKLVFGSKNKIIKLEKPTFQSLNSLIQQSFTDIPVDYSLSYLDTDKDEICLNSD
jgi:PB1 domain